MRRSFKSFIMPTTDPPCWKQGRAFLVRWTPSLPSTTMPQHRSMTTLDAALDFCGTSLLHHSPERRDGKTEMAWSIEPVTRGFHGYATDTLPYLTLWKNTSSLGKVMLPAWNPGQFPNNRGSNVNTGACPSSKGVRAIEPVSTSPCSRDRQHSSPGRAYPRIQQQQAPKILHRPKKKD